MPSIYTDDFSDIRNRINYLLNAIYEDNDKYDKINLYCACELLICEYWRYNADGINYYRKLNKYKNFINKQKMQIKQLNAKFLQDFIDKKDFHLNFCEEFLNDFSELEYIDLGDYVPINGGMQIYEEDEYLIFKEFLTKYHPEFVEMFDYLIKTNKIFLTDNLNNDIDVGYQSSGINIFNAFDMDYYIFIQEQPSVILQLSSLAHEFGHTIDYMNLIQTHSKKDYSYYTFKSSFIETISCMIEMEFCEYCLDNHLDTKFVKDNLQKFYINILHNINELNLICHLPNNVLKNDKYKKVSKEKLYKIAQDNCELAVDYDEFIEPSELNYNYDLQYGYGRALATYFSYLRKNKPSKYLEAFGNFTKIRHDYIQPNIFEQLQTTSSEMSKIVKEEINSKDVKIYIK